MRKAEKIETDVLCTYGCGQKAQYRFVNKKLCCSANAASCKAHKSRKVSRKGMKYKTYDSFSEEIINNVQVLCSYGCDNVAKYKFRNGRLACGKYPASCSVNKTKNAAKQNEIHKQYHDAGQKRKRKSHTGHVPWNKGHTKETHPSIAKSSQTVKEGYASGRNIPTWKGKTHPKEVREKLSAAATNSEHTTNFRHVKYHEVFYPEENKIIKVRGTFEREYANYLNEHNIRWRRDKTITLRYSFNESDILRSYRPDFYLIDTDEYIEIKGAFSEQDKLKMACVISCNSDKTIKILFRDDLLELGLSIK